MSSRVRSELQYTRGSLLAGSGPMRKLLLFDVDGTLVLTGGAGVRAMNWAFEKTFGPPDALQGVPLAGRTDRAILEEAVARALPGVALDPGRLAVFVDRYLDRLRAEVAVDGPGKRVLPGVRLLLEYLAGRDDIELALLTGNFEDGARIKLEHFDLWRFFGWGAYGGAVTDRNALLPVALAEARARGLTDLDPASVFVVGDTPSDVACARSGGARAIAVATGPYDRAALSASGADEVLEDLSDPEAFLQALS